jgi:hypothetical protein
MRRALIPAFLLLLGSVVLGATVFREDVARATGLDAGPQVTIVSPLDANGNVKVHEEGTASVSVTNTPNVNVANTPSVAVESGQTNPVSTRNVNDGQDVYQRSEETSSCTNAALCQEILPAQPTGDRIVIETVSEQLVVTAGTPLADMEVDPAIIPAGGGGIGSTVYLAPVKVGSNGTNDYYTATQQLHIYEDFPPVCAAHTTTNANMDLTCTVSGYLVAHP